MSAPSVNSHEIASRSACRLGDRPQRALVSTFFGTGKRALIQRDPNVLLRLAVQRLVWRPSVSFSLGSETRRQTTDLGEDLVECLEG